MWVHECLKSCPKMVDSSEREERDADVGVADSPRYADEPGEGDASGVAEDDEAAVPASFLPPKRLYPDAASLVGDQHRNTREYIRVFSKADSKTHPLDGFGRDSGVTTDEDGKKWFFQNIHVLFACFAWENISTGHGGVRLEEQYELMVKGYDEALTSVPAKHYFVDQFLSRLPFDEKMPPTFAEWLAKERRTHTTKQLNEFDDKARDADAQARMAFGKKLHTLASQTRSTITNFVNPLWVPAASWRSGESLMSVVCAVRERFFFDDAYKKAKGAAKNWANEQQKKPKPECEPWGDLTKTDKDALIHRRTEKAVFKNSYYESWYLVFFLFGVPLIDCGHSKSYLLSTLSSGSAHSTSREPPSRGDSVGVVTKHMRSHSEPSSVASSGSKEKGTPIESEGRRIVVVHEGGRGASTSKLGLMQIRVNSLEKLFALFPDDEENKAKYRDALQAVAAESEKMLSVMDVDVPVDVPPAALALSAPVSSFKEGMLTDSTRQSLAAVAAAAQANKDGRPLWV